jgi:hypothetical protein
MNTFDVKNKTYSILSALMIASFFGFFSACTPSKGRNRTPPPPPPPVVVPLPNTIATNCTTCMNMGQMAFMATTDSENVRGSMYLGLDFYGEINRGFDFNNPKIPTLYSGMVQANGRLQIKAVDTDFCNAPPGDYIVTTVNPGNWQSGVTGSVYGGLGPSNLRLEARSMNGYYLIITFAQGIIYNVTSINGTNKLETNRMGGTLVVESFNGQVCRSSMGSAISLELF